MKTSVLFLFTFLILNSVFGEIRRILFIGNSYTYTNDLPGTLRDLALSKGDTLVVDSHCPGGATFQVLSNDPVVWSKLQAGNWDYVVLQGQSQEPSFSPAQVQIDVYPYAAILDSLVEASNPCAETMFYMTWGRKNGDAGNCAAYPPVCTYEGMQQRLRESYLEMSDLNDATCVPVGVAWRSCRLIHPTIELYNPDESHPSLNGTYLAACAFYCSIYQREVTGAQFLPGGVTNSDAFYMQQIASAAVLDSLENWQQHGSLPFAAYTSVVSQNQATFTNTSLRANIYDWDFGDGSPHSAQVNPQHSYLIAGTYTVTLKASTTCKYDTVTHTVNVSGAPNNLQEHPESDHQAVFVKGILQLPGKVEHAELYDLQGKRVGRYGTVSRIDCRHLPAGIYLYSIQDAGGRLLRGKIQWSGSAE